MPFTEQIFTFPKYEEYLLLRFTKEFIVSSRVSDFVLSVTMITLERLNQSEPNFHTRLLTEITRPCTKMGIAGHM